MRTWGWGSVRPASLLSIPLLRVLLLSALLFNAGLGVGLPSAQAQEETLEEAPLEEGLEEALEEAEVIQLFPADDLLSDEVQDSSAPQGTQEEDAEETATRESFLPPTALAEEAIFDLPLASLSVLDETTGVLPLALWNSPPDRLNALFAQAQARTDSPASANLWRRILLSPFPLEATAPTGLLVPVTALDPGKTAQEATAEREAQETRVAEQAAAQETRSLGWFVWRTEQLQRLGRWRDLHRLFALVPRSRLLFAVAGGADNPQAETLAELARLRVETMILVGERALACEEATRLLQQNSGAAISSKPLVRATETWAQRLLVACRVAEGEADIALLGLDLLRETDFAQAQESPAATRARADFFALAAARLGYGKLPEAPAFSALNLFLADGLRGADLLALFSDISDGATLSPSALTGLAHATNLAKPLRIGLAERATEIGALDPQDLQGFYQSISFPPAEEEDLIAQAATLSGASQRAFLWQVSVPLREQLRRARGLPVEVEEETGAEATLTLEEIVAETAPEELPSAEILEATAGQLADLLRLYSESARGEGISATAAFLWRDTARLLPAERFLADHAEWIALVLLRSGEAESAVAWLKFLVEAQDSEAERALLSLWAEARLAGLAVGDLGGVDFSAWQGRRFVSTPAERVAQARQELHLRFLLDGLGARAANEDWLALANTLETQTLDEPASATLESTKPDANASGAGATSRALQDLVLAEHRFGDLAPAQVGALAQVALLEALDDASFGGRDGEALLLGLRLHAQAVAGRTETETAPTPSAQISQAWQLERAVVQGLRRSDFALDARALALEFWQAQDSE